MQILELIIYNKDGKRRQLVFKPGQMNIITGKSKSGKSVVGDIIDYCLGSKDCNISVGTVRESVSWYGLLLQFDDGRMFVARHNPDTGIQSTGDCYVETGANIESPEKADFESNINYSNVVKMLSGRIGIEENINIPQDGQTRDSLEASIRHALFYCIQSQDEIAAKNHLFHKQSQPFVTQAIKDSLPYFLGAVNGQVLKLEAELKRKKREHKRLTQKIAEDKDIIGNNSIRGTSLFAEAVDVGLAKESEIEPTDFKSLYAFFKKLAPKTILAPEEEGTIQGEIENESSLSRLTLLQKQYRALSDELSQKEAYIQEAKDYQGYSLGYNEEIHHQKNRLESIGLFEKMNINTDTCPFCSAPLNSKLPSVDALKASVQKLDESIGQMVKEMPRIHQFIKVQEAEAEELRKKRRAINVAIQAIYESEERLRNIQNYNSRRALVLGRISLWLESVQNLDDSSADEARLKELTERINAIEELLDQDKTEERVQSALSNIQIDMTQWAKDLELEGQGNPYRIDIAKATVVMDKDRPIPLQQMGSGSNWVGVHLIAMFALHKFFINHLRPVPGVLFLDQPSQVYFPSMDENEENKNPDWEAVKRIYSFIEKQVSALNGKLQVIIVDHARLNIEAFRNNIIENWWPEDNNLVPKEWIKEPEKMP